MHVEPSEVYDFVLPPILGGETDLDNIMTMDFEVSLYIAGQLHRQVRDTPPGTNISGVRIAD